MAIKTLPKTSYKMGKIVVGSALLVGLSLATMAYAKNPPLKTVESVELDRYLGVWYEVARNHFISKISVIVMFLLRTR